MTVRVQPLGVAEPAAVDHVHAVRFEVKRASDYSPHAELVLRDVNGSVVAVYAPGCWASAAKLDDPAPAFRTGGTAKAPAPHTLAVGEPVLPTTGNTTTTVHVEITPNMDNALAKLLRESLVSEAQRKADEDLLRRLRRIVRGKGGLKSAFGEDDDGTAGVREPVLS